MRRALALIIAALVLSGSSPAVPAGAPLTRIAFGSCAGQDRPQPFWDVIREQKPQVFLFLGDNVYADTFDPGTLRLIYGMLGAKEEFRRFRSEIPILATWDDHDYGTNDVGYEHPRKWDVQDVFLDFFGVPKDSPRRKQAGVYHAEVFGPPGRRVQIILLDTRFHRSKLKFLKMKGLLKTARLNEQPKPYVPQTAGGSTFLGLAQWNWLKEQLEAPAEIRIIASSIQVVADEHGYEKWSNIPAERTKLLKLLRSVKTGGVFILSGDRHQAELSVVKDGLGEGRPLYDFTSSSLNKPIEYDPKVDLSKLPPEPNRYRVGRLIDEPNFGMITVDWDQQPPVVGFELHTTSGAVVLSERVPLDRLSPN